VLLMLMFTLASPTAQRDSLFKVTCNDVSTRKTPYPFPVRPARLGFRHILHIFVQFVMRSGWQWRF